MKPKQILFKPEMVRAILDGRKSVMRRLVKPQPIDRICYTCMGHKHGTWTYPSDDVWKYWGEEWRREQPLPDAEKNHRWTPPCHTDDILYVREKFAALHSSDGSKRYVYAATDTYPFGATYITKFRWKPSIHMPKQAARLFLRVTNVRVERLQDITEEQAILEGIEKRSVPVINANDVFEYRIPGTKNVCISGRGAFSHLWDSTIKKADLPRCGWEANPWVWVIEFERISKEEATKNGL